MIKPREVDNVTGRSTDARLMLFLHENGPSGIERMLDEGVGSINGLYRALSSLIQAQIVEMDNSRKLPGRPYKLTKYGARAAEALAVLESRLRQHPKP